APTAAAAAAPAAAVLVAFGLGADGTFGGLARFAVAASAAAPAATATSAAFFAVFLVFMILEALFGFVVVAGLALDIEFVFVLVGLVLEGVVEVVFDRLVGLERRMGHGRVLGPRFGGRALDLVVGVGQAVVDGDGDEEAQ